MKGYLVLSAPRHSYLQRNGYSGAYWWGAAVGTPQYATVFTEAEAIEMAATWADSGDQPVRVVPDPLKREPEKLRMAVAKQRADRGAA